MFMTHFVGISMLLLVCDPGSGWVYVQEQLFVHSCCHLSYTLPLAYLCTSVWETCRDEEVAQYSLGVSLLKDILILCIRAKAFLPCLSTVVDQSLF